MGWNEQEVMCLQAGPMFPAELTGGENDAVMQTSVAPRKLGSWYKNCGSGTCALRIEVLQVLLACGHCLQTH